MTHEEKVKLDDLISSALEGKTIQKISFDQTNNEIIWIDCDFLPIMKTIDVDLFRVKSDPTREEITAQWVKDNDVKVGDRVKLLKDGSIGEVTVIHSNLLTVHFGGLLTSVFKVGELQKVTSNIVKFTFEDREEFRGKWVRWKNEKDEYIISSICDQYVIVVGIQGACKYSYEAMLRETIFVDGRPFGKEIWE